MKNFLTKIHHLMQAFFAAGNEVNQARQQLTEGKLSNLKVLGIDIGLMLRQIGNRIGREIAFR